MADNTIDRLQIVIEADDKNAKERIDALTKSLQRLNNATKKNESMKLSIENMPKDMEKSAISVRTLNNALGKTVGALTRVKTVSSEVASSVADIAQKAQNLGSALNKPVQKASVSKQMEAVGKQATVTAEEVEKAVGTIEKKWQSVGDIWKNKFSTLWNMPGDKAFDALKPTNLARSLGKTMAETGGAIRNNLSLAFGDVWNAAQQTFGAIGRVASSAFGHVRSAIGTTISTMQRVGSIANSVARSFAKVGSAALSIAKAPLKPVVDNLKNVGEKARGVLKALLRIAKLRIFRGIVKSIVAGLREGISNAYQWASVMSNQFAGSMDRIATSTQYLKNSLGAMAMPIFNALAPVLDALIDKVVTLLNFINQLIARLTGQGSWTKAVKVAKSYGGALNDAAGSAGKLKDELLTILGIDELNVMNADKDSGGGGGGGGAGGGATDMFEEVAFNQAVSDFADLLKKSWENADFTEVGTIIGNKLNEALERIPWEKLKETAAKVGKSLATLLNGIVEVDGLGENIGTSIGEAFNTAYTVANNFVKNLHWDSIGKFIGNTVNGFMDSIDWAMIRETASATGRGIGDAINSIFDTIKWEDVGNTLAQSMNTVFDFLYELGSTIKWSDIGSDLATAFNSWASNFDWKKAGATLNTWANGLLDFFIEAIEEVDWSSLGEDVGKFIREIDWAEVIKKAFVLGADAIIALADFGTSLMTEIGEGLADWRANMTWGDVWDVIKGFFTITREVTNGLGEFAVSVLKALDSALTGDTTGKFYTMQVDAQVHAEFDTSSNILPYPMDEFGNYIIPATVKPKTDALEVFKKAFAGLTLDEIDGKVNLTIGSVQKGLEKIFGKEFAVQEFSIRAKVDVILGSIDRIVQKLLGVDMPEVTLTTNIKKGTEKKEDDGAYGLGGGITLPSIGGATNKRLMLGTGELSSIPVIGNIVKAETDKKKYKEANVDTLGVINKAIEDPGYMSKPASISALGQIKEAVESRTYRTPTLKALGNIVKADQGNYIPEVKGTWNVTGEPKNVPKAVQTKWDINAMNPDNPPKSILSKWGVSGTENTPESVESVWNANNKKPINLVPDLYVPWNTNNKNPINLVSDIYVPWNQNNKKPQNVVPDIEVPWNQNNKKPLNVVPDIYTPWNHNNKKPMNVVPDLVVPWNQNNKKPMNVVPDIEVPWNQNNKKPINVVPDLYVPWNHNDKKPINVVSDLFVPWNQNEKKPLNVPGNIITEWNQNNKAPINVPSSIKSAWDQGSNSPINIPSSVLAVWRIAAELLGIPSSIISGWNLNHAQPTGKSRVDTGWDLDYRQPINKPNVNANLNITGQSNTPTIYANLKATEVRMASGGVFERGKWHTIPQYASGTLNAGSYFVAGEAGPELVGHVGGRTEVLNQSQLAATMAASMQEANSPQNALLREQNGLLRELIAKQGTARAYVTAGDVVDGLQAMNRRDGRTVVPIGV